jgi:NADPH2:quinone reductase
VLRYEDAPTPEPGPDEVLIALRAAALNHLDVFTRSAMSTSSGPGSGVGASS